MSRRSASNGKLYCLVTTASCHLGHFSHVISVKHTCSPLQTNDHLAWTRARDPWQLQHHLSESMHSHPRI